VLLLIILTAGCYPRHLAVLQLLSLCYGITATIMASIGSTADTANDASIVSTCIATSRVCLLAIWCSIPLSIARKALPIAKRTPRHAVHHGPATCLPLTPLGQLGLTSAMSVNTSIQLGLCSQRQKFSQTMYEARSTTASQLQRSVDYRCHSVQIRRCNKMSITTAS
jgi:hypothetical protein